MKKTMLTCDTLDRFEKFINPETLTAEQVQEVEHLAYCANMGAESKESAWTRFCELVKHFLNLDIIDTEQHPNIRKAIVDHEAETLDKFNQEIETKTAADILASWYLKRYTTPKTLEAIKNTAPEEKPAADILAKMKTKKAREEAKNTAQRLEALALAESCKLPESVNISVEFTRSRTWGSIPHATITAEQRRTFGTASGCGYDTKGYRTAKNAEFNKNSFRSMFKNERYIGIYKYKDLRIEGGVPAIVDKDTFAIVQKKLSKNAEAPSRGKAKIDYLLSQKLFCGHCGSLMTGESGTGKGGTTYFYYTCGKRKREHTCDKKPLKKDFIERAVVEDALTLLTPETIDELADIAVNESIREMEENSIIPALKDQLHETERSINNLVKMVEKGVESDTIADRLKELEKEKRAIEKRLVVAQDDYVILEKEHIVWWLSDFCNGDIEDEEFRRHIIDLLVNSVTVWDEPDGWYKITSVYNLTSNKTKTFRCSDLSGQAPPNSTNPNFLII